ncbi:MAG TPA: amino acid ABC transporter permease [Solirubrobacterales bacterium]|nr:amino acid ABC transporter permease [Solirubrobacterales bacterium]
MSDALNLLTENFGEFASGLWVTIRIVGVAFVIAMVVGTAVAGLRVAPSKALNRIGGIYVETFRNIPLLVLLLILYIGVRRAGLPISAWVAGTAGLGLYTAAYIAEALRSGVFAVGKGQIEAALSLGMTYPRTMRRIILPQAFRTVIPAIGSLIIAMVKNSAIVGASLLALPDLLKESRVIQSETAQTEAFLWAAVGYLLITITVTVVFRQLETRYAVRR